MHLNFHASQKIAARRFIMYLPDKNRAGVHINTIEEWVSEACLMLTKINGGATRLAPAKGMWLNEHSGQLIQETTHIIFSCVRMPSFLKNFGTIRSFIARFGQETDQDSVAVEFEGAMYFLTGEALPDTEPRQVYLM